MKDSGVGEVFDNGVFQMLQEYFGHGAREWQTHGVGAVFMLIVKDVESICR